MIRREYSGGAGRKAGRNRIAFAVLLALCVWMPGRAGAQLPSLIDLSVPLGQEVTPVYRVFGDELNSVLTGDIEQAGALALGDFNGDSFGDLLMGTPTAKDTGGTVAGGAYILYGSMGLPGTYADLFTNGTVSIAGETRILGGGIDYVAGHAVATGDVDGDGYDDAIIGQPGVGGDNPGHVRVVFGAGGLPSAIVSLTDAPSNTGIATTEIAGVLDATNPATSGQVGRAVASGDINGDGYDDVIIGAYRSDTPGGTDAGAVYVVFGGPALRGTSVTTASSGVSRILGDDAQDGFGWSVASGDANGDGYDDVVVGAPNADPSGGTDAGEVHVVYGAATWPETIDLNTNGTISAAQETRITGDDASDNLGCAVAAGDVNGDGFDEVLAGAYRATPLTRSGAGEAYVVFGSASLSNSIVNLNTSTAGETRLLGAANGDQAGFSIGAGDVDGDGRADVLVGARQAASPGGLEPGLLYVVPASVITAASSMDIAALSGRVVLKGFLRYDFFGSSAAGAVDMNRDGYGDFVSLAPNGDNPFITANPQNNAGYAAVVFGDGVSGTASATTSFAAGATPLKGLGGRLSPGVRAWLSFDDGAAGKVTGVLTRSSAGVTGIPEATAVDVAQVLWQLATTRSGWTSARVVLRYADSEVAGLDETKLVLYRADSPSGEWTALATAALDTDRNEVSVDVDSLGYFALAADTVAPALSIGPPSLDITRDAPVSYTITYSRASTITLAAEDVLLDTTGSASATVTVTESGTDTRVVTLSNLAGDGTIGISIAADTARDESDNPTPGAGPSVPFRVDHTAPEVVIGAPSAATTSSGPVSYTVTYAGASAVTLSPADVELVTGFVSAEVAVTGDAGSSVRTVTLSNITGDGTQSIRLAAGSASDEVGNLAPEAGPATAFTVDNTPPTVAIGDPSPGATRGGPVTFAVTYVGASSIALSGKVTLNRTGTANGTVGVTANGANSRLVTISGITGDGTLGISIQAGSATDALGNAALAAGPSNTFTVDNTGPSVNIGPPSVSTTQTGPVEFPITYTGASNVTLAPGDVTLVTTGTATGTVAIEGSGETERTVVIDNITGDGTLGISLASGTASDAVGNSAPAAGPSANVAVGSVELAVSIGAPSSSLTRGGPVSFTITYTGADEVTLQAADVSLDTTGSVNGTVAVLGTGTSERTVVVSDLSGDGTFTISLVAGTASNTLGNSATAVGPSQTVTVDNTAPTLIIGAPSVTATQSGPVTFVVQYQGADFVALATGDIQLIQTGSATAELGVSGSGIGPRTVTLSNVAGNGTLAISVASGTALDAAGNSAPAAGPSATVVVDNTGPTLVIGAPSVATTVSGPVSFTVTYSGATAVNLVADNVHLVTTGNVIGTVTVAGSGASFTVTVSSITGTGTLAISIDANTATDALGNLAGAAGPSAVVTVQSSAFNPADVNRDTKLNATDVQMVINAALGRTVTGFPDVNSDGKVNATDVQRVINAVLGRV